MSKNISGWYAQTRRAKVNHGGLKAANDKADMYDAMKEENAVLKLRVASLEAENYRIKVENTALKSELGVMKSDINDLKKSNRVLFSLFAKAQCNSSVSSAETSVYLE